MVEFRGASLQIQTDRSPDIVIVGPAGTGKSFSVLYKMHRLALANAGIRILIARRSRKSLTNTALVTYERNVLGFNHPIIADRPVLRRNRQTYEYPNGSEIDIGGLDPNHIDKILSSEYDIILVIQAEEITESNYEVLTTRLRGGVMSYEQIILDVNPVNKTHWIKRRIDSGLLKHYQSYHTDNPSLWDQAKQNWTKRGLRYIEKLKRLTGVRYQRLYQGLWASTEGAIYADFDPDVHVIDQFAIPASWPRIIAIDFGYTAPLSISWYALDNDRRLYKYRQIYQTQTLIEDIAPVIISYSQGENIIAVISDHDAEDRATLAKHGIETIPAFKIIKLGIEAVQLRLRPANDGKVRLYFMRDSLVTVDERLADDHKPLCTEDEIDGYQWSKVTEGKPTKDSVPAPNSIDHGLDELRYAVCFVDDVGIELQPKVETVIYYDDEEISQY
jgi:PBSX family phage terminase large subunit